MDLCVVEENWDAPAGLLGEWAEARGHRVITLRAPEIGAGPWPDPTQFGAIAPLGAEQSVHASPDPWIAPQVAWLRAAHAADVPVLGVCWGGQALAAALGGAVRTAAAPEIGWLELESLNGGAIPPGPWFAWHGDVFTPPPGAVELARTDHCVHAFRLGRSIGLQFHPEVTPSIVDGWVQGGRHRLEANAIDVDAMQARTRAEADADRERSFALFDALAADWTDDRRTTVQSGGRD
ncbi:MAG TPA: gamma-glutamyl-gamma-aminobutyrate hydrolase family protein [Pseudonocardia sp.]|nr:gamma-glutamyl-gamma-aminobutyrate hydrolase family protein [Pseudonocardia sp.]